MHCRRLIARTLQCLLASTIFGVAVHAQSATATLSGRVMDETGAVVGDVAISVVNKSTGLRRDTRSNEDGYFTLPFLPPGTYVVKAEREGFTPWEVEVPVSINRDISLEVDLHVGGIGEAITVLSPDTVRAELYQGTIVNTINQLQISELPSVTRNPYDFVSVAAGVAPASVLRGVGVAVNGQRVESASFLLDGSDNNEPFQTGPAQTVPLDAVQEYTILTNSLAAEYGRNSGFIANLVTKSGSNEFHGTAYDFVRNSALAANTFQNNANQLPKASFNRHQFGGAVGGPIGRDRLFFHSAFESIRVRSSAPVSFFVPTGELIALSSPGTQAIFRRFPIPTDLSKTNVRNRLICPFGRACDAETGNGFESVPALAFVSRTGPKDAGAGNPQDTYLWTLRWDWNMSSKTVVSGRYAFHDLNEFATVAQPYSAELDRPFLARNQNGTLNVIRTWDQDFLTESRVVFSRVSQITPGAPREVFPSFLLLGEDSVLPLGRAGFGGPQNVYQLFQTAIWVRGNHTIKAGGQFLHTRDNRFGGQGSNPLAFFLSLQNLVDGAIFFYRIPLDTKGVAPGGVVDPPFGAPSDKRHFRHNDLSFFVQDTWNVGTRLTVSPGIRWEYFGQQHSPGHEKSLDANFYYGEGQTVFERIANGQLARTVDAPGRYRRRFYAPDYNNFAPRLGLAWDVFGDRKTVFRGGAGLFYDRFFNALAFFSLINPPNFALTPLFGVTLAPEVLSNPYAVFPNNPIQVAPGAVLHVDQDLKTAYSTAWNATVERVIGELSVRAAYVGSSGTGLYSYNDNINRIGSGRFLGRPDTRLFNTAADFFSYRNLGHSTHHAAQLAVDSNYIRRIGLLFGINYTWSHSIDNLSSAVNDDSTATGFFGFQDPFNPDLDKGPSDFDVRHRVVTNFVWQIPAPSRLKSYLYHLLGGWQVSGILSFQTGQPFSLNDSGASDFGGTENVRPRLTGPAPNVQLGQGAVPDSAAPNRFLILNINQVRGPDGRCLSNATPFACLDSVNGPFDGTIGRNTFWRPGTHFENIAVGKIADLSGLKEGLKLQWRVEFYNVLNHSNLYVNPFSNNVATLPFNSPDGPTPGVTASYGTSRVGAESRQIVIAAKLLF